MLRREFLLGAAAAAVASTPAAALAADGPPLSSKAAFVAWMTANRPAEDPKYLERRWDRYQVLLSFNDLWTPADKRAFLMTPRQEFCLPESREDAYVGHYLDIGFGVTITPPGTMGRMTSALDIRGSDKVLEIGTGSGFQSALLTYLTPQVHSIEIIPELAGRTRGVYDRLDRRRLSGIFRDRDPEQRRLLRLGGGGAVRQDHRHLRHRPHPAAAAAAIEAERDHGHSRGSARGAAYPESGQESRRGRRAFGRALGHFRRQGHPFRAAVRRPPERGLILAQPFNFAIGWSGWLLPARGP